MVIAHRGMFATAIAYEPGGDESTSSASNMAPIVKGVIMAAIRKLLGSL